MGFLIVGTGGGGSSAPDGTLPAYTTMSALDAGLTTVGRMAQLVGATTGAVILTCRRVAAGAGGLEILGPILLWQADGTEFDGSFAWAALGTAGAVTWGAAGTEEAGGLIPPVGTVRMGGFRPLNRFGRARGAVAYFGALPGTPAGNNGLLVGEAAAGGSVFWGSGWGYSSTTWRAAIANNMAVDGGTLSVAAGAYAPPVGQRARIIGSAGQFTESAGVGSQFTLISGVDAVAGQSHQLTNSALVVPAATDLLPVIHLKGTGWAVRVTRLFNFWELP